MPIHPVTVSVALRAGQIDGENQARGTRLPLSDLLIGVTALELGYSVATANVRHFRLIPGLPLIELQPSKTSGSRSDPGLKSS
jgi:predicted nucleic acid-binding protein